MDVHVKPYSIYAENTCRQEGSRGMLPRLSGSECRSIRIRLGYTQEKFGAAIGKSRATVNRWEKGKRPIPESCAKLINVLAQIAESRPPTTSKPK